MTLNTNRPKQTLKKKGGNQTQTQRGRFINTAKELEVDESGEHFERVFGKLVPPATKKNVD